MNVLHVGNADSGYVIAKELRKKGLNCDFLTSKQMVYGKNQSVSNPLNFDAELEGNLPSWMQFYDLNEKGWKYNLIKKMRKYDLIHAYMESPIFAMFSLKPIISQSVGDDLRELAFQKSIRGYLLRRAYHKSKAFIFEWPPHKPFVEKLGIKNPIFIPKLWDTTFFQNHNIKKNENRVLKLFHPLTQNWKEKGNDKFLKAFVRLCKEDIDVFLYYIDWGEDSQNAKEILNHPKVKNRVEIIPGPVSKERMLEYMKKSDILIDQFNSGSFTRTGIEGLNFGIPLLINFDKELHDSLFGESPPVFNARNEDEVFTCIKDLVNSKDKITEVAKKSQKWVKTHYDKEKNIQKYLQVYQEILGK